MRDLEKYIISSKHSVRELMERIGRNARGIILVTDAERHLKTTLTDGDVRRALLDGIKMDDSVDALMCHKKNRIDHAPFTVDIDISDELCMELMEHKQIRQLPVVDSMARVVDIVFRDELLGKRALRLSYVTEEDQPHTVPTVNAYGVIMAGGFGTRLKPLTDHMPKPMLPLNGRPLLELIIERFERAGIRKLFVSTYYKREVIEDHFEDGSAFNVEIEYIHEDSPIGTAGALGLMEGVDCPLVMTNGDILTKVGMGSLLDFHHEHGAMLTVGVRQFDIKIPFGVMNTSGATVLSVEEKPVLDFLVNAGVYVISPEAHSLIPKNQHYDMTDLIDEVIRKEGKVVAFPIVEYWLDIGQMTDYEKAQEDESN